MFNLSCTCFYLVALVLDNVKITPDRVKILVGETLVLNCTAETTFNGRLQFDWDFPRTKVRHFFHYSIKKNPLDSSNSQQLRCFLCIQNGLHIIKKQKGNPAEVTVISSTLELENITMEDKGLYSCKAEINPTKHRNATAKVHVYGERRLSEKILKF